MSRLIRFAVWCVLGCGSASQPPADPGAPGAPPGPTAAPVAPGAQPAAPGAPPAPAGPWAPGGTWETTEKQILSADEVKNWFVPGSLRVSPDGTRYAVAFKSGWVIDGKTDPSVEAVYPKEFVFSGGSKHYAYASKWTLETDAHVYVDGKQKYGPMAPLSDVRGLVISHDGSSVSYLARSNQQRDLYGRWVDGNIVFSQADGFVDNLPVWPGKNRIHYGFDLVAKQYGASGSTRSADGEGSVFIASRDNNEFVVLNGKEFKSFGRITDSNQYGSALTLGADGKHVVYRAGAGVGYDNKWFDTKVAPHLPLFLSPDGTRWAARVGANGKERVFVDGVAGKEYYAVRGSLSDTNQPGFGTTLPVIAFSPDGKQVAYPAVMEYEDEMKKKRSAAVMVRDGAEQKRYAWVSQGQTFSPDGRHLLYLSSDTWGGTGERHVTVDGVRVGKGYEGVPAFSPDSKSIGLMGKRPGDVFAVLDGQEQKAYDAAGPEGTRVGFTPDGRYTFIGVREGAYYWVEARRK